MAEKTDASCEIKVIESIWAEHSGNKMPMISDMPIFVMVILPTAKPSIRTSPKTLAGAAV